MNYCPNCGKDNKNKENYCSNCGFNFNNKQIINEVHATKYDTLEIYSIILLATILALYTIISCISASGNAQGATGGLYIIIGIPFGLILCDFFPIVNYIISISNQKKRKVSLSILEVIFNILTIFMTYVFYYSFLDGTIAKNSVFYFNIVVIVISIIAIIINMIMRNKKQ